MSRWIRRFGYVANLKVAMEGHVHERFKALCAERGETMGAVLRRAIYAYCGEEDPVMVREDGEGGAG